MATRRSRSPAAVLGVLNVCTLLAATAVALPVAERDLIGWSETAKVNTDSHGAELNAYAAKEAAPRPRGVKILSWDPRIFLFQRFLTDEECDHIITKAGPRLTRSGVVDVDKPESEGISDIRTSYGMFFDRGEDMVIAEVERRLSEWSLIPVGHGEGIQVLRYYNGQEYKPHFDFFFDNASVSNGGNRLATVLMYLSDVESGGETVFPNVPRPPTQTQAAGYSECAMEGLAVKPRKGDAVLFFSLRTEGTLDKGSLHGSCPVIGEKTTKWAATKWYHVAHYAMGGEIPRAVKHAVHVPPPPPAPPGCKDDLSACSGWAEGGECDANPGFMVGTRENPGSCLLSCGRCDLMPASKLRSSRKVGGIGAR